MSAQLAINDFVIDLPDEVTYNFKAGDVGEISLAKSTYTSSFQIGKTSEIVALFRGLGVAGDRSTIPYIINDVVLMDDYSPLLTGTLVVLNTDDEFYNVTVISGAFDFFTEIGDTSFSDINISAIIHEKTVTVIDGLLRSTSGNVRYGIAQFGGMSHYVYRDPDTGVIVIPRTVNIDTMVPAISAKYLWDRIFSAFPRFSFSGAFYSSTDFEELYLTFPYGDFLSDSDPVRRLNVTKSGQNPSGLIIDNMVPSYSGAVNFVQLRSGGVFVDVLSSGYLRVIVERFDIRFDPPYELEVAKFQVRKNNVVVMDGFREFDEIIGAAVDLEVVAGDYITFTWTQDPNIEDYDLVAFEANFEKIEPSRDIFDLSLKTFVKEVMWRYGLVAIVERGHIEFVQYGDIINSSNIINWSSKYAGRDNEEYSLDYAQSNWLRHRYDFDGDSHNDKNISVSNKNLPAQKTLIQSDFFSPSNGTIQFGTREDDSLMAEQYITFEGQEGDEKYKKLNRHFWTRVARRTTPYRIGSAVAESYFDQPTPTSINVFTFDGLSFRENTYYNAFSRILTNTRVHRINLILTAADANNIDLKSVYYFEQEQSYYILNSLRYKKGELASGEFIKLN